VLGDRGRHGLGQCRLGRGREMHAVRAERLAATGGVRKDGMQVIERHRQLAHHPLGDRVVLLDTGFQQGVFGLGARGGRPLVNDRRGRGEQHAGLGLAANAFDDRPQIRLVLVRRNLKLAAVLEQDPQPCDRQSSDCARHHGTRLCVC